MNILPRRGEYQVVVTESDNPELTYSSQFPDSLVMLTTKDGLGESIGDEPALIAYDKETNQKLEQVWLRANEKHRDHELPANIFVNGPYIEMEWYINGALKKTVSVLKETGHTRCRVHYNDPPNGEPWDDKHSDEYIATIDRYDPQTGQHLERVYSKGGTHYETLEDAPKLPFPNPEY